MATSYACAQELVEGVNFRWVQVKNSMATVPAEGESYTTLYDDWGPVVVKNMTWDEIYTLACDPWEAVYYPRSLGTSNISNIAVDSKVKKTIKNGQLVIVRDGKTYNAAGVEL